MAAGFAVERLRLGRAWGWLAAAGALAAAVAVGLAVLLAAAPPGLVGWTGVAPSYWPTVVEVTRHEAGVVLLLALAVGAVAWAVRRGVLRPGWAVALLAALAVADLARAGAGLNRQEDPSFFDPLPDIAALRLDDLDGGRVFSYGLDHSPTFREVLGRGGRALTLTGLYLHRQILAPYANVIDRVQAAEANDLTGLAPRERELGPDLYDPARVGELLPWLRNAGVARVLSLDPLSHGELIPLAAAPAGPPGVAIHVYGVDTWPRASLACRATPVAGREQALGLPYGNGFDPGVRWRSRGRAARGRTTPSRRPAPRAGRGACRGRRTRSATKSRAARTPTSCCGPATRRGGGGSSTECPSPFSGRTASTARSR
jgi:hypothetical protein